MAQTMTPPIQPSDQDELFFSDEEIQRLDKEDIGLMLDLVSEELDTEYHRKTQELNLDSHEITRTAAERFPQVQRLLEKSRSESIRRLGERLRQRWHELND